MYKLLIALAPSSKNVRILHVLCCIKRKGNYDCYNDLNHLSRINEEERYTEIIVTE